VIMGICVSKSIFCFPGTLNRAQIHMPWVALDREELNNLKSNKFSAPVQDSRKHLTLTHSAKNKKETSA